VGTLAGALVSVRPPPGAVLATPGRRADCAYPCVLWLSWRSRPMAAPSSSSEQPCCGRGTLA